jgi:hypothetical protein
MRQLLSTIAASIAITAVLLGPRNILPTPVAAAVPQACSADDVAAAVDQAGASLRRYTMETGPGLQRRVKALALKKNLGEEGYEEAAFETLKDDRIRRLDTTATELLQRIDQLGEIKQGEAPDCSRVEGIRTSGAELLTVMKTKTAHLEAKLDAELGPAAIVAPNQGTATPGTAAQPPAAVASPTPATPVPGTPAAITAAPAPAASPAPAAPRKPATSEWSATTAATPPSAVPKVTVTPPTAGTGRTNTSPGAQTGTPPASGQTTVAVLPSAPPAAWQPLDSARRPDAPSPAPDTPRPDGGPRPSAALTTPPTLSGEDGYSIEEIREATRGFFGQFSTGLAAVIEHAFRRTGRPTGYVVGVEGGAAFIGGLRYGHGTLYMRSGQSQEVFWHGPSLGFDFGAAGTRVMFLAYKLRQPDNIHRAFTGIDGSAFVVGGVGLTLLGGGDIVLAPIRSGLGVRVGANIGYVRFTPQQTWNPF